MSTVFDESRGKHGRWPLLTAGTAFCGTGSRAAPQDYSQLQVAARIAAGHCQPRPAQRAPLADAGRFGLTSTWYFQPAELIFEPVVDLSTGTGEPLLRGVR